MSEENLFNTKGVKKNFMFVCNKAPYGTADSLATGWYSGASNITIADFSPRHVAFRGFFTSSNPGISELEPGNYFIQITDSNNLCVAYENIFLPNPEPINISYNISDFNLDGESNDYNGYSVSCFGSNDGQISISVSGGSGVYTATLSLINEPSFF